MHHHTQPKQPRYNSNLLQTGAFFTLTEQWYLVVVGVIYGTELNGEIDRINKTISSIMHYMQVALFVEYTQFQLRRVSKQLINMHSVLAISRNSPRWGLFLFLQRYIYMDTEVLDLWYLFSSLLKIFLHNSKQYHMQFYFYCKV